MNKRELHREKMIKEKEIKEKEIKEKEKNHQSTQLTLLTKELKKLDAYRNTKGLSRLLVVKNLIKEDSIQEEEKSEPITDFLSEKKEDHSYIFLKLNKEEDDFLIEKSEKLKISKTNYLRYLISRIEDLNIEKSKSERVKEGIYIQAEKKREFAEIAKQEKLNSSELFKYYLSKVDLKTISSFNYSEEKSHKIKMEIWINQDLKKEILEYSVEHDIKKSDVFKIIIDEIIYNYSS